MVKLELHLIPDLVRAQTNVDSGSEFPKQTTLLPGGKRRNPWTGVDRDTLIYGRFLFAARHA